MRFRVVGDYFRYWIDVEPSEVPQIGEASRKARKCRGFYIKKQIKQIFNTEGKLVYQSKRWDDNHI